MKIKNNSASFNTYQGVLQLANALADGLHVMPNHVNEVVRQVLGDLAETKNANPVYIRAVLAVEQTHKDWLSTQLDRPKTKKRFEQALRDVLRFY